MKNNEGRMKQQTNMNDNSKISGINGRNEPCRGLAIPTIFLYSDIKRYPMGAGMVHSVVWSPLQIRNKFQMFLGITSHRDSQF
ncbi:hypothetical protein BAU27_02365 [Bacillus sp. NH11B]|nr:hypothetical protein BAU27_02365 [Bacillus sp. NH11B]